MILGIDHFALTTVDAERAARFYIEHLGFEESGRLQLGDMTIIFIARDGTQIELFGGGKRKTAESEVRTEEECGYKHLALLVDDVDAETARLKKAGAEFFIEPMDVAGLRIAFFKDPDGNIVEFMKRP